MRFLTSIILALVSSLAFAAQPADESCDRFLSPVSSITLRKLKDFVRERKEIRSSDWNQEDLDIMTQLLIELPENIGVELIYEIGGLDRIQDFSFLNHLWSLKSRLALIKAQPLNRLFFSTAFSANEQLLLLQNENLPLSYIEELWKHISTTPSLLNTYSASPEHIAKILMHFEANFEYDEDHRRVIEVLSSQIGKTKDLKLRNRILDLILQKDVSSQATYAIISLMFTSNELSHLFETQVPDRSGNLKIMKLVKLLYLANKDQFLFEILLGSHYPSGSKVLSEMLTSNQFFFRPFYCNWQALRSWPLAIREDLWKSGILRKTFAFRRIDSNGHLSLDELTSRFGLLFSDEEILQLPFPRRPEEQSVYIRYLEAHPQMIALAPYEAIPLLKLNRMTLTESLPPEFVRSSSYQAKVHLASMDFSYLEKSFDKFELHKLALEKDKIPFAQQSGHADRIDKVLELLLKKDEAFFLATLEKINIQIALDILEAQHISPRLFTVSSELTYELVKRVFEAQKLPPSNLMHLAARSAKAVDFLITHGLDLEARDSDSLTTLHWAVMDGRLDSTIRLLLKGANPNALTSARTAGYLVIQYKPEKWEKILTALIQSGDSLKGPKLETPLNAAILARDYPLLEVLLENGLDPYAEDHQGRNAFQLAQQQNDKKASYLLNSLKRAYVPDARAIFRRTY